MHNETDHVAAFEKLVERAMAVRAATVRNAEQEAANEPAPERNTELEAALAGRLGVDVEVYGPVWEPIPGSRFYLGARGSLYVELEPAYPDDAFAPGLKPHNQVLTGQISDANTLGALLIEREKADRLAAAAVELGKLAPAPAPDQVIMTSRGEWWIGQRGDRVRLQIAGEGLGAPVVLALSIDEARALAVTLDYAAARDDKANTAWREAVTTTEGYVAIGFDPEWGHRLYQVSAAASYRRAAHKMTRADANRFSRALITAAAAAGVLTNWREAVKEAGLNPPPIRYADDLITEDELPF